MIRWSRRTSAQEDAQERQRARVGPGGHGTFSPEDEYFGVLLTFRSHLWLVVLLMGIAVLAGTGFGRMHAAGAWTWVALLSLVGAGQGVAHGAPLRALAPVEGATAADADSAAHGCTNALIAWLAAVFIAAPALVSGASLRPISAQIVLFLLCATVVGFRDLMRRTVNFMLVFAAPFFLVLHLWPEPLASHLSDRQAVCVFACGLAGFVALLRWGVPGVPHPALSVSRAALLAVLMSPVAAWTTPTGIAPVVSPWHLAAWAACLAVVILLEWIARLRRVLALPAIAALIHLGGPLAVPAVDPGPLWAHLAAATVEFGLVLVVAYQHWRALLAATYYSGNYRTQLWFVPRLDRGLDHPLESDVLDRA